MHELAEEHPEVQIHASASRISRACSEVSALLRTAPTGEASTAAVHAAVEQLRECEVACQDWLETVPYQWKPKHKAATSDTAAESPQAFMYYRDIWVAIAHYYHRSFRIQLHETLVRAMQFSSDAGGDVLASIERSQKAGRELIEENMLSVPFLLGQVDSCGDVVKDWLPLELGLFHAAVALKMIVRSPLAAEGQKERAREFMEAVLHMARRETTENRFAAQ
ncbi:hypothetical protein PRZ48_004194 [Zasmidium cellare]|uniref:Uncharacterized protein n=1 Tax=Zasmidium cellare TaxID=395010 RepID=A0ABR0EX54_ZASCE|nr:hypothetical protein PRZ48_004194 [Zasmidium cellare]